MKWLNYPFKAMALKGKYNVIFEQKSSFPTKFHTR